MPRTSLSAMLPAAIERATSPPSAIAAGVSTKTDGAADRFVVGLAHAQVEGADEIEVGAALQPGALHDGLGRESRAGDEIGLAHRRLEVRGSGHGKPFRRKLGGESFGALRAMVPERHPSHRALR